MELSDAAIDSRLERWPVARLATVAADGRPHQVPIVFARTGTRLWSPIDGKPKRGGGGGGSGGRGQLARVRPLRARPQACLLLDDYTEDWSRLWWLRIDVTASVVDRDAKGAAAAVEALRRKYPQYAQVPVLQSDEILLAFEPTAMRSWCASEEIEP